MARRRETYTAEFKARAVKIVTNKKLSVAEAARRLGVGEKLLPPRTAGGLHPGSEADPEDCARSVCATDDGSSNEGDVGSRKNPREMPIKREIPGISRPWGSAFTGLGGHVRPAVDGAMAGVPRAAGPRRTVRRIGVGSRAFSSRTE